MAELARWSITEARQLALRHGATAVVEEMVARRARTVGPAAGISRPAPAALRARAAEVDARLAAGHDLALAGVPFAVKDNIDVAGVATTAGCAEFAYAPAQSAPVVEQLVEA